MLSLKRIFYIYFFIITFVNMSFSLFFPSSDTGANAVKKAPRCKWLVIYILLTLSFNLFNQFDIRVYFSFTLYPAPTRVDRESKNLVPTFCSILELLCSLAKLKPRFAFLAEIKYFISSCANRTHNRCLQITNLNPAEF